MQQLIDIELLKAYRTANRETQLLLEKIYGQETFGQFNETEKFRLLGCIARELMDEGEGLVVTHPYMKDGVLYEFHMTLEKRSDKFTNADQSESIFERAWERFKKLTKDTGAQKYS